MTPQRGETYQAVRLALDDMRGEDHPPSDAKWARWIQVVIAVGAIVVSIVLAYGALDKRLSMLEQALAEQRQKLDFIIYQQNGKR